MPPTLSHVSLLPCAHAAKGTQSMAKWSQYQEVRSGMTVARATCLPPRASPCPRARRFPSLTQAYSWTSATAPAVTQPHSAAADPCEQRRYSPLPPPPPLRSKVTGARHGQQHGSSGASDTYASQHHHVLPRARHHAGVITFLEFPGDGVCVYSGT